jgi:hypothetical protein
VVGLLPLLRYYFQGRGLFRRGFPLNAAILTNLDTPVG